MFENFSWAKILPAMSEMQGMEIWLNTHFLNFSANRIDIHNAKYLLLVLTFRHVSCQISDLKVRQVSLS